MISLKNITKYYMVKGKRKYIFKNVNLDIPSDKSVGILGLNGQGKSTLIKILGGSDHPNSGTVVTDKRLSWPLGLSSGFQSSLTGSDNTKFICRINGIRKKEKKQKIKFIKDFADIGDYFDMPIKEYSSGMKSRLAFAISMAFDFDVYLIDEILSVGDKDFRKKCKDAMDEKRTRSTIIMVSHDLSNLKDMCDTGIILNNGKFEYYEDIVEAIEIYNEG